MTLPFHSTLYYQSPEFYYAIIDGWELIQVAKDRTLYYEVKMGERALREWIDFIRTQRNIYKPAEASVVEPIIKRFKELQAA